ncbi:tetratricopeptide repeat protein, partial [candidate division KSB1 bacterium]|nr:tetratricopeptide repeat protein [candidate division KSB1 bacterium]
TLGRDNYIVETLSLHGLMGLPFIIGLVGMFFHFNRDWKRASSILTLFIMTGIAITIYLNQDDPQPRERDYAYVGSFFAFSIWIGMGASAILELVQNAFRQNSSLRKVGIGLTILLLIVAVPSNLYQHNAHSHDRSGNYVAFDYSYNILQSCEPNAILFTNGDNDTFPLWYLQYVEGIRDDVRVVNLSLLNTPWYIKQLRDEEPKVPITFTDAQIDQLGPALWSEPKMARVEVPRDKLIKEFEKGEDNASISIEDVPQNPAIEFELAHTKIIQGHPVLLVQDRMIIHILATNKFKKPVYFAVTVSPTNMLNLDNKRNVEGSKNYLRMDGLAFQVMPYGGPRNDFISPVKLEANLFENFKYRNLDNPEVYYNNNILGLLQNYRSAFLRLTNYYRTQGLTQSNKEKALAVLQKMDEVMPEEVIPLRDFRLSLNFGQMYSDFGSRDGLIKRLDKISEIYNMGTVDQLYIAEFYAQILKNNAKAESLAVSLMDENPETKEIYLWLASHYTRARRFDDAIQTLQEWMKDHPDDFTMKKELTELQAFTSANDSLNISNGSSDSSSVKDSNKNP